MNNHKFKLVKKIDLRVCLEISQHKMNYCRQMKIQ